MKVVHRSRTADEAARLLAVADATRRVRPPGIVRVVDVDERVDGVVVVTTDEPEPGDDAPASFEAAASALAALHSRGVAHGAVPDAARRRDAAGRAVLPLPVWRDDETAGTLDGDVAALCRLAGEPPAVSALELATRLATPSPRVLETTRPRVTRPEPKRKLPRRATAGALVAVAGVVTMGVAVVAPFSTGRPTVSTPPSTTTTSDVPATVPASTERVVALAGHRYEVGVPGDLLVLGVWSCRPGGPLLPVVVRPRTGDVLVFESAGPGATATAVTRLDGVTGAGRAIDAAGCDRLLVDARGGPTEVDVATGRGGGSRPRSPAAAQAP